MPHSPAIGIDLGTTFSVVAYVDETGKPVVLKNGEGGSMTPSVIAFTPGGVLFGDEAKSIQSLGDGDVASFFKRSMGDPNFFLEFHGKRYDATALSGLLLNKLKVDAEAALGRSVSRAVITVPAYFNHFQREATVEAGRRAGLDVLRIINEPTAAAIAYGIDRDRAEQTLLVYDLGGGTFDVTLVRSSEGTIRVVATDGDHELGGKDWDNRIMRYVVDRFKEEYGGDPTSDVETLNDLAVQCEEAKKKLSRANSAVVKLFHDGNKGKYTITRERFVEATVDLVERTKALCHAVASESGTDWRDIDGVLLVGGSTRMPMIVRAVEDFSGGKAVYGIDIDEAVAIGAAVQAAMDAEPAQLAGGHAGPPALAGRKAIHDVTSHSLGIIAENADRSRYVNAVVLPKNSGVPAEKTRSLSYRTLPGGSNEMDVYLLQGESDLPDECAILGRYVFSGIEHENGGNAVLEVTYRYDRNGIVSVSGVRRSTGKKLDMRIEPVPENMDWVRESPRAIACPATGHVTVLIAVDSSGSMVGPPMQEAKKAAKAFLDKVDLSRFTIGIMVVADRTSMVSYLSQNAKEIEDAIDELNCDARGTGYANAAQPFTDAREILEPVEGTRFVIVLTDGVWENQRHAVQEARKCHDAGIGVIALGFGEADERFLKDIASCDENALFTDLGRISDSFSTIAQVLTESGGKQGRIFVK